jgi:hypothetical protein
VLTLPFTKEGANLLRMPRGEAGNAATDPVLGLRLMTRLEDNVARSTAVTVGRGPAFDKAGGSKHSAITDSSRTVTQDRGLPDAVVIIAALLRSAILLATLIPDAQAQTQWGGNRLYATCRNEHAPSSDCAVFIRGVVDRYHEFIATHCAPQEVPFGEIVDRVIADLKAYPSRRTQAAPDLILDSIGSAYRCRLPAIPAR